MEFRHIGCQRLRNDAVSLLSHHLGIQIVRETFGSHNIIAVYTLSQFQNVAHIQIEGNLRKNGIDYIG